MEPGYGVSRRVTRHASGLIFVHFNAAKTETVTFPQKRDGLLFESEFLFDLITLLTGIRLYGNAAS